MGVSLNVGTPKSSILIGFSIINHPFWGTPIFGVPPISILLGMWLPIPPFPGHSPVPSDEGFGRQGTQELLQGTWRCPHKLNGQHVLVIRRGFHSYIGAICTGNPDNHGIPIKTPTTNWVDEFFIPYYMEISWEFTKTPFLYVRSVDQVTC